jgi:hypothetical protein
MLGGGATSVTRWSSLSRRSVLGMRGLEDLRVLTVRQPHAWAIIAGHKDVENRSWRFTLPPRTTVALLAGKQYDPPLDVRVPDYPQEFVHGAVIGVVTVLGSHMADRACCLSPWAHRAPGIHHWALANPVQLHSPIPARGQLFLASATREIREAVSAALT